MLYHIVKKKLCESGTKAGLQWSIELGKPDSSESLCLSEYLELEINVHVCAPLVL